ncbi:MAG: hypothetical protein H6642_14675 [Caldilineaceae bacterium]|nr:hypothetical protein [Caldilineaceae bacterium]
MWKEALAAPGQTDDSYLALRQRLDRLIGRTQSVGIMPYRGYETAESDKRRNREAVNGRW